MSKLPRRWPKQQQQQQQPEQSSVFVFASFLSFPLPSLLDIFIIIYSYYIIIRILPPLYLCYSILFLSPPPTPTRPHPSSIFHNLPSSIYRAQTHFRSVGQSIASVLSLSVQQQQQQQQTTSSFNIHTLGWKQELKRLLSMVGLITTTTTGSGLRRTPSSYIKAQIMPTNL